MCKGARGRTEHPSCPIAMGLYLAFAFATLFASTGQSQPRGEVFLTLPSAHICSHFADELQRQISPQARKLGQVASFADTRQQLRELLDGRGVAAGGFARRRLERANQGSALLGIFQGVKRAPGTEAGLVQMKERLCLPACPLA
jgi:hypothetical protein